MEEQPLYKRAVECESNERDRSVE
eukprot:SAG11_NODE_11169_length_779_cov_1.582353_1_plen_23_part_01